MAACLECGEAFKPRQRDQEFCSKPCKDAWANRRKKRGPIFYDMIMAGRYERATHSDWIGDVTRFASVCRDADNALRAGRRSWAKAAKSRQPLVYSAKGGDGR